MLVGIVNVAKAQDVLFELGNLNINIPLKVVKAAELYVTSGGKGKGFTGAESVLLSNKIKTLEGVFGGAVSPSDNENFIYVGAQGKLSDSFFDTSNNDIFFGGFVGRNFRRNENYCGIKASVPLW